MLKHTQRLLLCFTLYKIRLLLCVTLYKIHVWKQMAVQSKCDVISCHIFTYNLHLNLRSTVKTNMAINLYELIILLSLYVGNKLNK